MTYKTYEAALARVAQLQRDFGMSPGIITCRDGSGYKLTHDVAELVVAKVIR